MLNTCMKVDAHAQREFSQLLEDHYHSTGVSVPPLLHTYLTDLLAERIRDVDVIPGTSFAESYMIVFAQTRPGPYKHYADSCLFFVSLLPEYGAKRGLSIDYYCNLGISSYYTLGDLTHDARYTQLGNWFKPIQKILNTALRPEKPLDLWSFE